MLMKLFAILCIYLTTGIHIAECVIVGGFVLPHGGIALNPSRFVSPSKYAKQWAWQVHTASVEVGKAIRDLKPDIIVLSTPHGVADLKQFMFYMNGQANGTANTDNCQCPPCCYDVDIKLDYELTAGLMSNLSSTGHNVSGLTFSGPPGTTSEPSDLKWGEVIPLVFIKDLTKTKVVILSQPSRRYTNSISMIPELLRLGHGFHDQLDGIKDRVAVVISADLAHTHQATGPYGYSKFAEPFDKACGNWASTLHPYYLLDRAAQFVDQAESCGYTGLVMLHGILEAGQLSSWVPVLHANYHPSYYGMMVASFVKKSELHNSNKPWAEKKPEVIDNSIQALTRSKFGKGLG